MIKFRLFYDKDLEEKWLNNLSDKGWAFKSFFAGIFIFERCEPGKYLYKIDMLKGIEGKNYKEFMQELNIEPVQQWFRWIVLRKKKADGPFELYTDVESKIAQYTRIRNFFIVFAILMFAIMLIETFSLFHDDGSWYLINIIFSGLLTLLFVRQVVRSNMKILELK